MKYTSKRYKNKLNCSKNTQISSFEKKIFEKVIQNYKYFDLKLMYFFEKNLFRNIDIASSPITLHDFLKNMKNTLKNYLHFAKKIKSKLQILSEK